MTDDDHRNIVPLRRADDLGGFRFDRDGSLGQRSVRHVCDYDRALAVAMTAQMADPRLLAFHLLEAMPHRRLK